MHTDDQHCNTPIPAPCASRAKRGKSGVILLHGLCRSGRCMRKMAAALEAAGYCVVNLSYPSRTATVEELSQKAIDTALADPRLDGVGTLHFVTHSLGGILLRCYLAANRIDRLGRVVMLGPPNQGSEIVDRLGDIALFSKIHGPSGKQLGTAADALPNRLGPANFELGIIAGDRSINLINSLTIINGPDDGKVSVQRTKLAGMTDHIVIHAAHPFLMRDSRAIRMTIQFLQTGFFRSHPNTKSTAAAMPDATRTLPRTSARCLRPCPDST